MKGVKEILIDNERVSVKKGVFGYRVVYPIKDNQKKIVWVNLLVGGWGNFFKLLFILLIITMAYIGFDQVTESCRDLAQNPCDYYKELHCDNYIPRVQGSNPSESLRMVPNYTLNINATLGG